MAEKNTIDKILERLVKGDFNLLAIGILFMMIPIAFFIYNLSNEDEEDMLRYSQERLSSTEAVFSFKRTSSKHVGVASKNRGTVASILLPSKQWNDAVKRITTSKTYIPPQINALPPKAREYYEAEMNKDMRMSNMLISQGRFDEARVICEDILQNENENDFLRFMASGNLCTIYDEAGNVNGLRKEFLRYLDLLESLKIKGFKAANLKRGFLAMNKLILRFDEIRADPSVRQHVQQMLEEDGLAKDVTVDMAMDKTLITLKNFPSTKR